MGQGHARRMSSRGVTMKCSAAISWHVERQWPGRLTVSALRIIPYPKAGGASRAELLEYASYSIPQKTCNKMMLAETICCPPSPAACPCCVCSNGITVDGVLPIFKDPYSLTFLLLHTCRCCHCPCIPRHCPLCRPPPSLLLPLLLPPLPPPYFLLAILIAVAIALATHAIALFIARYSHCHRHCSCRPCHCPLCCPPSSLPSPSL